MPLVGGSRRMVIIISILRREPIEVGLHQRRRLALRVGIGFEPIPTRRASRRRWCRPTSMGSRRKILMMITMRREPPTSGMSHMFEFRFLRDEKQVDPDITNIAPLVMTTAEITQPTLLAGQVVSVTPGVFRFGL